jgi:hypothetical protein
MEKALIWGCTAIDRWGYLIWECIEIKGREAHFNLPV